MSTKILFGTDTNTSKKYSRLVKDQQLRRIYRGIYTNNLKDPLSDIVRSHWMQIVPNIIPKSILSFRTAIDLKPAIYKDSGIIFLTGQYNKTITLPGLIIKLYKGNYQDHKDQVLPNLAKSDLPRTLLENLTPVKNKSLNDIKTIGDSGVEKYLTRELSLQGEARINQIRDQAKGMAHSLGYEREYKKLNDIISALLSTKNVDLLKTPLAQAFVKNESYDENRLHLFEDLSFYLQKCSFKKRPYHYSTQSFRNLSFFESYFSNYIEGTEFLIDEAEDIVFKGKAIENRHADSHDVLANFYLSNDYTEMCDIPDNFDYFLTLLKKRHAHLMKERPEIKPGEFKDKPNRAGNTFFVEPKNVIGTLKKGFEIYQVLKDNLARASFLHFLISEVHPFNDGNGRLSRIMMNSELVRADLFKIIIPTVCRDNYLGGLRRASRDRYFHAYCKIMDQAQAYTSSIPWADYGESRKKIEDDMADKNPDEGLPIFNRAVRSLTLSSLD